MPWFKVDDQLAFHQKTILAGNAAMGLWARAGSWCAAQLTDGFVPEGVVDALAGTSRDTRRLVAAGLWDAVEGGWQFHDWAEYQPTREQVLAERAAAAERQRKSRGKSHRDSDVTDGVSSASPSRPVPSPTQIDDGDTHKPGTKVDARVGETGSDEEFVREAAAVLGIKNLDRVRAAFAPLVGASAAEAVDLARALLELSSTHVRYPEAYIEKTCVASPEQVLLVWGQLPRPGVAA